MDEKTTEEVGAAIDACDHERSAVIDSEPAIDARTGFAIRGFVSEYIECPDCDLEGWFIRAVPEAEF